jgi:multisubunit Na+/H+ antiporter MnhB subunit
VKIRSLFNLFLGCALTILIFRNIDLPYGSPPMSTSSKYLANCISDTGVLNVVSATILDYRAFDTLIEITVLFAAILGVTEIFRR